MDTYIRVYWRYVSPREWKKREREIACCLLTGDIAVTPLCLASWTADLFAVMLQACLRKPTLHMAIGISSNGTIGGPVQNADVNQLQS